MQSVPPRAPRVGLGWQLSAGLAMLAVVVCVVHSIPAERPELMVAQNTDPIILHPPPVTLHVPPLQDPSIPPDSIPPPGPSAPPRSVPKNRITIDGAKGLVAATFRACAKRYVEPLRLPAGTVILIERSPSGWHLTPRLGMASANLSICLGIGLSDTPSEKLPKSVTLRIKRE